MKRFIPSLIVFLSLFHASVAFSQQKLAVIGSSTSACYNMDSADCYINQVVNFYGINDPAHYLNRATPGMGVSSAMPDTYYGQTYNGFNMNIDEYRNISAAMGQNSFAPAGWTPDVVLVNYPTNYYNVLNIHDIMYYIRTIRNYAVGLGARVYVTTSQPRSTFTPEARDTLMAVRDSVLAEYGDHAIDFWNGLANPDGTIISSLSQADGIHLNVDGQNILFQRVKDRDIFNLSPLPVKLTSFSASLKDNTPFLQWTADEESAGTKYYIQRSSSGAGFQTIAIVNGEELAIGNKYTYADGDATGAEYYRLQVVEHDNTFYSETKYCKLAGDGSSFIIKNLFPVPADGNLLTLQVQAPAMQTVHIEISSALGVVIQSLNQKVCSGLSNIPITISGLSRGMYFLKISPTGSGIYVRKFTRN